MGIIEKELASSEGPKRGRVIEKGQSAPFPPADGKGAGEQAERRAVSSPLGCGPVRLGCLIVFVCIFGAQNGLCYIFYF